MTRINGSVARRPYALAMAERFGMPMDRGVEGRTRRPLVVLVDDDEALLNALTFALETEGYRVEPFPSGESLLAGDLAVADCFIIDDRLAGGMSGIELIVELRANDIAAPAIVITTHPSAELVSKARALGASIIEKPLMGSALAQAVQDSLRSVR